MKKTVIIIAILALGIFAIAGCGKKEGSGQTQTAPVDTAQTAPVVQPAAAVYYCPMHPDEVSDKPGKCSKCGMDLVEKPSETK
ncbi:MAG: hypothetical protein L0Z48_09645 [candidate division Zixibacteria bacterium]|nr:hypothetical protein [candidate division Zixibacteria bacterium]MCI0596783.1 hypothetical protein [candidate division Zixibacteria bacterium]